MSLQLIEPFVAFLGVFTQSLELLLDFLVTELIQLWHLEDRCITSFGVEELIGDLLDDFFLVTFLFERVKVKDVAFAIGVISILL